LVAWKAQNLREYKPSIDDVVGFIFSSGYNAQVSLLGILAMVIACVKPIATNFGVIVNPFATNAVKPAQIYSWWYEEITGIYPAQRNSDSPHAYISVANAPSQ